MSPSLLGVEGLASPCHHLLGVFEMLRCGAGHLINQWGWGFGLRSKLYLSLWSQVSQWQAGEVAVV